MDYFKSVLRLEGVWEENKTRHLLETYLHLPITALDLSECGLADEANEIIPMLLQRLPTLTEIIIPANNLNDDNCVAIADAILRQDSPPLRMIDLSSNFMISSHGITSISSSLLHSAFITHLDISCTSAGDACCDCIGELVRQNVFLRVLNLSCIEMTTIGLSVLADATAKNSTLSALDISKNNMRHESEGENILAKLIGGSRSITNLDISTCQSVVIWEEEDDFLQSPLLQEALAINTSLKVLNLSSSVKLGFRLNSHYLCSGLGLNTCVTSVDLSSNYLDFKDAENMAQCLIQKSVSISTLVLYCNQLKEEGARVIAQALHTNLTVTHLDLGLNGIGDVGAVYLAEVLLHNSTLSSLVLDINGIGLYEHYAAAEHFSRALSVNRSLTSLSMRKNSMRDSFITQLMSSIEMNTSLLSLAVEGNFFRTGGVCALCASCIVNSTVTSLSLDSSLNEEEGCALADLVSQNSILRSLDVTSPNDCDATGARCFIRAMCQNTTVESFSFLRGWWGLRKMAEEMLVELFTSNVGVTSLRWGERFEWTPSLLIALEGNTTLLEISGSSNNNSHVRSILRRNLETSQNSFVLK